MKSPRMWLLILQEGSLVRPEFFWGVGEDKINEVWFSAWLIGRVGTLYPV